MYNKTDNRFMEMAEKQDDEGILAIRVRQGGLR